MLNARQIEAVLNETDVKTPFGIRDRAILETLYSTAMHAGELCGLELGDVDADRGVVFIAEGKGKKDRFVPIGERALGGSTSIETTSVPTSSTACTSPLCF